MMLGNNIQKFRRRLNISQEELAEKCGVSRQAVTKWETSESTPSLEKIILLADIFDISTDELLGRVAKNTYSRLMDLVKEFAVEDIPHDEEDDISAIVARYLLFTKKINIDSTDVLNGLQEIFLHDVLSDKS